MRRITLIIASIILLCNISFGQHIDWQPQQQSYITYSDDHKIMFDSGNGFLSGKYELLADGRTLTYEVTVNVESWYNIWEFSIYAQLDEYTTEPVWWDDFYSPYPFMGVKTFSGSMYLDYTTVKPFYLTVQSLSYDVPSGFILDIFGNYYPE